MENEMNISWRPSAETQIWHTEFSKSRNPISRQNERSFSIQIGYSLRGKLPGAWVIASYWWWQLVWHMTQNWGSCVLWTTEYLQAAEALQTWTFEKEWRVSTYPWSRLSILHATGHGRLPKLTWWSSRSPSWLGSPVAMYLLPCQLLTSCRYFCYLSIINLLYIEQE